MEKTLDFWIAVGVVIMVKIKSSPKLGFWQVSSSITVAIGAAYAGASYASEVFGAPESISGAIVALTAEGVMRWILAGLNNPKEIIDLWKYWRGK